jgi:hypothetical protein
MSDVLISELNIACTGYQLDNAQDRGLIILISHCHRQVSWRRNAILTLVAERAINIEVKELSVEVYM